LKDGEILELKGKGAVAGRERDGGMVKESGRLLGGVMKGWAIGGWGVGGPSVGTIGGGMGLCGGAINGSKSPIDGSKRHGKENSEQTCRN
jgi:hypothetical protein